MDSDTARNISLAIRDNQFSDNSCLRKLIRHTFQGVSASLANWLRELLEANICDWEEGQKYGDDSLTIATRTLCCKASEWITEGPKASEDTISADGLGNTWEHKLSTMAAKVLGRQ